MSGFIHFPKAGLFLNAEDITAVELDEYGDGTEFLNIHMRRPNTSFTITANHQDLIDAVKAVNFPDPEEE